MPDQIGCQHRHKSRAKNVTVPLVNENGHLQLNSHRGQSIAVKSIVFCSSKICERVFDYEPVDLRRAKKLQFASASGTSSVITNNN